MRRLALALALTVAPAVDAATRYVALDGIDAPARGASDAPFRTIGYGLARTAGGDTLVVREGLYTGVANFINDGRHAIADGSPGAPTVVRAEVPFSVRIRGSGALQYYDSPLRVRGNHVDVDGFVFELVDNTGTPMVGELEGSWNRVTRSIFRRQGGVDAYGGWLHAGGHHQLVQDVGGVGAARYGFSTGGPTDDSHHIVFRRVVGRFDFSPSSQPKATFNAYGTDSGWGVHHVAWQNCIALDGQRGPGGGEEHYGAWYLPKNMDAARITGSIALNNDVAHAGLFVQEMQGRDTVLSHVVAWDNGGAGLRWNGSGATLIEQVTIGAQTTAIYNGNGDTPAVLRHGLFEGNGALFASNDGFAEFSGSAFAPTSQAFGSGVVQASGALRHLPDASLGTGLAAAGARILQRIGIDGTRWDEPGWDQPTGVPLWPWPYEDALKAVFAEANPPLPGNTPSSNDTVRGFTVAQDGFGRPMTLTRYVWQYLGHEIPAAIYGEARVFRNGFEN